jgi:hypothetical protein
MLTELAKQRKSLEVVEHAERVMSLFCTCTVMAKIVQMAYFLQIVCNVIAV